MTATNSTLMRAKTADLRSYIRGVTLDVIWRQWAALGGMTSSKRRATSLIDPEALVLISLAMQGDEPRLGEVLADWAAINSDLLSVQRVRNVARHFSAATRTSLSSFALIAFEEGRDHRWKSLLKNAPIGIRRRDRVAGTAKRAVRAHPIVPAALMLRLRLAFGVGIKADTLSFLLSTEQEGWAGITSIATATGYTAAAVRKAAQNLVEARFVEQMENARSEYHVNHSGWRNLLEMQELPSWRAWALRFAFVDAFLCWVDSASEKSMSSYMFESRGRELLKKHQTAFRWGGGTVRMSDGLRPNDLNQTEHAIRALGEWMDRIA